MPTRSLIPSTRGEKGEEIGGDPGATIRSFAREIKTYGEGEAECAREENCLEQNAGGGGGADSQWRGRTREAREIVRKGCRHALFIGRGPPHT